MVPQLPILPAQSTFLHDQHRPKQFPHESGRLTSGTVGRARTPSAALTGQAPSTSKVSSLSSDSYGWEEPGPDALAGRSPEPTTAMALGHLEPPLAHFRTHLDRIPSAATSAPASHPSPGQPQRAPDPTPPIADAAGIAMVWSTSGHQKSIAGELRLVLDADLSDHPVPCGPQLRRGTGVRPA
jgi:hypothetical protein